MSTLKGMHITAAERLRLSANGNPRFNVAMIALDGAPHVYVTQSDASVSYDVEDLVTEHRKDRTATVSVELTRAGRITYMRRTAQVKAMRDDELGQYVCVGRCQHSPHITITADGLWVKTGQEWSSAHRDCFEARP